MSKFKSSTGQLLLQGLFFEQSPNPDTPIYTLKDEDHRGLPSLYRLYMETDDPTEYTFATTYLAGWDHWERLCKCGWFKPYIDRWRREVEIRLKARALVAMREEAKNPESKNRFAANKFLLDYDRAPKEKNPRGRPTKQEIQQEATRLAEDSNRLEHDFNRILGRA